MRISVDLAKSYRLLNHGPTVLVSSAHQGRRNVMAAAWSMPLDFAPPKVAVVIEASTYTRELVDASQTFALNVPVRAQAELTLQVGHVSGREVDKLKNLPSFEAAMIEAPLVEGCVAWLECRVIPERHIEKTYDLFVGEIVAAWADDRFFADGRWLHPPDTLHYVAGGKFFLANDTIELKTP